MDINYKALRASLGLRQVDLAADLGVTRVSVGRWEKDPEHAPKWYWYALMGMTFVHQRQDSPYYLKDD